MSLTSKEFGFRVGESWVDLRGVTRAVNPEWTLVVDGDVRDTQRESGRFMLTARLADDQELRVEVNQGNFGSFGVEAFLDGTKIQKVSGFLL